MRPRCAGDGFKAPVRVARKAGQTSPGAPANLAAEVAADPRFQRHGGAVFAPLPVGRSLGGLRQLKPGPHRIASGPMPGPYNGRLVRT